MKKTVQSALLAVALAGGVSVACSEEAPKEKTKVEKPKVEEPKPKEKPEEKKVEIPAYEPEGEHADVKKEAAAGITAENALEKAKALEAELDKALAGGEGEEGGEKAATE